MTVPPDPTDSRAEIADLVHRYAYNVRHRLSCTELFSPEIEFVIRQRSMQGGGAPVIRSHIVGLRDTVEYIQGSSSTMALCPLIHNLLIEIEGDRARSTCVMENRTWPAIAGLIGEYEDEFLFIDRWRFSKRVYTMFAD